MIRLLASVGRLLRMVRCFIRIVGFGLHVASIGRRVRSVLLAFREYCNVSFVRYVLLRSGGISRFQFPRDGIVFCQRAIIAGSVGLFNGLLAALRANFRFVRLAGPFVVSVAFSVFFGFQVFSVFEVEVGQIRDQVAFLVDAILLRDMRAANRFLHIFDCQLFRIAANEECHASGDG